MVTLNFSARALVLAMMTLAAVANPIDVSGSNNTETDGITPCSTVRCASGTVCEVIANRARCVPIKKEGEKCGATVCAVGLTCCNASCGTCVQPGMMCTQQACGAEPVEKVRCGPNVCPPGQECCNESCGMCVEPGKGCTKQFCLPTGPKCGPKTCYDGEVCCNQSCGICTPPGGFCTMQFCG